MYDKENICGIIIKNQVNGVVTMAKNHSNMDYAKYRERRNKSQKFWKDLDRANKRSVSNYKKKEAARKRRRKELDRKLNTDTKNRNVSTEPLTIEDIGIGLVAIIAVMVCLGILVFWGIKGLLVVGIVTLAIYCVYKQKRKEQSVYVSESDIEEMHRLLGNLENYQEIINNSNDVYAVQCSLDELLNTMDMICCYSEQDLNVAGMTKKDFDKQKKFILDNYDTVLEQAADRFEKSKAQKEEDSLIKKETSKVEIRNTETSKMVTTQIQQTAKDAVEKREEDNVLKGILKSKQGLYPHEILMLEYAHTYKTKGNSFQGFWKYQYYVDEPQKLLNRLCEQGFIEIGDVSSVIENMKVVDIKKELSEIGEATTGKKADLVCRLLHKADLEQLGSKYKDRYYRLTLKGQQEVEENQYVAYLHKHPYMSIWEMNKFLNNNNPKKLKYRDIIWRELNNNSTKYYENGDFGFYRNTRLAMHDFLIEENKYENALGFLCEVALYDLNGLGNGEKERLDKALQDKLLQESLKYYFPYKTSILTVPPGIVGYFGVIQEHLKLNDEKYKTLLIEMFNKYQLRRNIFTNNECADIVLCEIGNHPRKLNNIYKLAEERIRKELGIE